MQSRLKPRTPLKDGFSAWQRNRFGLLVFFPWGITPAEPHGAAHGFETFPCTSVRERPRWARGQGPDSCGSHTCAALGPSAGCESVNGLGRLRDVNGSAGWGERPQTGVLSPENQHGPPWGPPATRWVTPRAVRSNAAPASSCRTSGSSKWADVGVFFGCTVIFALQRGKRSDGFEILSARCLKIAFGRTVWSSETEIASVSAG